MYFFVKIDIFYCIFNYIAAILLILNTFPISFFLYFLVFKYEQRVGSDYQVMQISKYF